jgi:hypothetical protein
MRNKALLIKLLKAKPEKALKYLLHRGKNVVTADDWQTLRDKSHDKAFTVAGITKADYLQDIYKAVVDMKENGVPLEKANAELVERLRKKGWIGSGNRFKVTLDTNMKIAHSQGFYETMLRRKDTHPYWKWNQIERNTKRHDHTLLHGKVFRVEDAVIFPPADFGCDCSPIPMTEEEFISGGHTLSDSSKLKMTPELKESIDNFGFRPGKVYEPDMAKYSPALKREILKAMVKQRLRGKQIKNKPIDDIEDVVDVDNVVESKTVKVVEKPKVVEPKAEGAPKVAKSKTVKTIEKDKSVEARDKIDVINAKYSKRSKAMQKEVTRLLGYEIKDLLDNMEFASTIRNDKRFYDDDVFRKSALSLIEKRGKLFDKMTSEARETLYAKEKSSLKFNNKSKFDNKAFGDGVESFDRFFAEDLSQHTILIKKGKGTREFYDPNDKSLNLGPRSKASTVAHELGHWYEDIKPGVHDKIMEFYNRRTKGDKEQRMKDLFPGEGWGKNEIVKTDKFIHPYMGLVSPDGKSSEILSMGLDYYYTNPVRFAKEDPDYFDFIYNLVRGK